MFKRPAGWLILTAYGKIVSHYFKADQVKAVCGNAQSREEVTPSINGYKHIKPCPRCSKINRINNLPINK